MKKLLCAILCAAMLVVSLAACGQGGEKTSVRIAGMTGPTGMGLAKLLEDDEQGISANDYEFTLAGSADVINPMVINNELDIAAVPANVATVLYNKTGGQVRVLAVNTLGVIYIVNTDGSVAQLSDLVGKTIYATGQGATPEYTLRYILSSNGIDPDTDVTIEFKSEPTEVVSLMGTGECTVAMLPQPYVTVAQSKVENVEAVIDLTEEWNSIGGDGMCLTGVVIASAEFVENNPKAVKAFLKEYEASISYANENVEAAAELIGKFEIVNAAIAQKALPACNLTYIGGEEMKSALEGYLTVLFGQNPASVGGAMPADDFYYVG